jgi:hypothetical protein
MERLLGTFFGFLDKRGRGIYPGIIDAGRELAAEDALAAAEVEEGIACFEGEELERLGKDDMFMVVVPFFADEAVVPFVG